MPDDPTGTSARPPSVQIIGQQLGVQQLYANGFLINLTAADISIVLLRDNVANASISVSFTTAKTLCEKLGMAINKLEAVTKREIMTTDFIEEGLKKEFDKPSTSK